VVLVVNWNRRELLREALSSLAGQNHDDFEVMVVDNGSDDGSAEMVEGLAATFRVPLQLIRNQENRGFCAANNQGIAATQSRWVALLNNDAMADSGWLTALAAAGERDSATGMVASKILVAEDPRRIDKVGHLMYPDGQNRGRGTGQIDQGQFDREDETLWPDGCAALYRRAMLEDVGGFDEDLFAYADDAELGLRGRWAGWTCRYAPGAVVRHHRGATLGLGSGERLKLIERNRVLLAVKLFPWNLLWLNGAYHLARIAGSLWASLRKRGETRHYPGLRGKFTVATALAWGWLSALPLIPGMLRKRRTFRSKRRMTPRQIRQLLLRHRISLREISEAAN
jgi:GT2 family glycosyltransferase